MMKWMPELDWLGKLPSTNYRIWISGMMEVLYVVSHLLMMAFEVRIQLEASIALGTFITAWLGLDVTQFRIKRKTHAAATSTTPSEKTE